MNTTTTNTTTHILTDDKGNSVSFRVQENGMVLVIQKYAKPDLYGSVFHKETMDSPAARRQYKRLIASGYFAW